MTRKLGNRSYYRAGAPYNVMYRRPGNISNQRLARAQALTRIKRMIRAKVARRRSQRIAASIIMQRRLPPYMGHGVGKMVHKYL